MLQHHHHHIFLELYLGPSRFSVDLIVIFSSSCVGSESCGGAENCKGASLAGWSGGLGNTPLNQTKELVGFVLTGS